MKRLLLLFLGFSALSLMAQESRLDLNRCTRRAVERYPQKAQENLYNEQSIQKDRNLQSAWYPQMSLNAQASWQSEVTGIDINLPFMTIVPPDKDQYKMTFDMGQLIYDGGQTADLRKLEKKELEYNQKNLESELYKVKERVSQVYFSILQLQLSEEIFKNSLDDLETRLKSIRASVKNGVMLESNAMVLEAEIVKLNQMLHENMILEISQFKLLGMYMDTVISAGTKLDVPALPATAETEKIKRLENEVFRLQAERIDLSRNLAAKKLFPKVSAFGQLGYGKPGLNMLSSDFDDFYMVGARLSWTFWNWNQTKREKKGLDIQRQLNENQQKTFNFNLDLQRERQYSEILRLEEMKSTDEKLIAIRSDIVKVMASQLENGIITASQYITEKNTEISARLSKSQHEVLLAKARVDYALLTGNF